ncbi:MAG TPA: glycosyltransferase family 9 protein [Steroidobacteraceae bacterium]|nr:glycosyltransferase family 9 protein [Steroidobacteraceae bacterium]
MHARKREPRVTPLFTEPPASVCILRLSAIGDVCHVLPVVRTLQQAWPNTKFTWVIGKLEAKLLGSIPEIEFVVLDKSGSLAAFSNLRRQFRGRKFDLLMHMQLSIRASAAAAVIPARVKLGFDVPRARELQWLFTTHRIERARRQHVLDSLFGFAERVGIRERLLQWDIPLPEAARIYAQKVIPDGMPTMIISPCSSHRLRNWRAEYYAQVADFAATAYGMRIVLCGGRSELEKRMGEHIAAQMSQSCTNMIGKDTLPELLATLERATLLLSPDSGPAHMATAVGTPVLGLYAATNPQRSGPYLSRQLCVDKYDAAARALLGKPAAEIPWTTKIEREGVMDLITPDDVIKKLQSFMAQRRKRQA